MPAPNRFSTFRIDHCTPYNFLSSQKNVEWQTTRRHVTSYFGFSFTNTAQHVFIVFDRLLAYLFKKNGCRSCFFLILFCALYSLLLMALRMGIHHMCSSLNPVTHAHWPFEIRCYRCKSSTEFVPYEKKEEEEEAKPILYTEVGGASRFWSILTVEQNRLATAKKEALWLYICFWARLIEMICWKIESSKGQVLFHLPRGERMPQFYFWRNYGCCTAVVALRFVLTMSYPSRQTLLFFIKRILGSDRLFIWSTLNILLYDWTRVCERVFGFAVKWPIVIVLLF